MGLWVNSACGEREGLRLGITTLKQFTESNTSLEPKEDKSTALPRKSWKGKQN